jgi:hypothetical protein
VMPPRRRYLIVVVAVCDAIGGTISRPPIVV